MGKRTMKTLWLGVVPVVVALLTSFAGTRDAAAQPGSWAPSPLPGPVVVAEPKRSGLVLGFSMGGSLGSAEDGLAGTLGSFYVGGHINPKLALLFSVTGFGADDPDDYADCWSNCSGSAEPRATDLGVVGATSQAWLSDRLWFKGTLGAGYGTVTGLGELEGLGWGAGLGFDVYSGEGFAFDARFDLMGVVFEEGSSARAGFGLGFTWR